MDSGSGIESLSNRQKEILRLIGQHYQMKEIARILNVSVSTVRTHTEEARRRLGVATSREAALILLREEGQGVWRPDAALLSNVSSNGDVTADIGDSLPPSSTAKLPEWLPGWLKARSVAECVGIVVIAAVVLAFAFILLLAAAATMVQAIQNLTGQTI